MRKLLCAVAIALLAVFAAPAGAQQQAPPSNAPTPIPVPSAPASSYAWTGVSANNGWAGGYGGGLVALNGSLLTDGVFLLRGDVSGGQYRFGAPDSIGTVRVSTVSGAVLLGYRMLFGPGYLSGYLGPAIEDHSNAPRTSHLRGTEAGGKVLVEYFAPIQDRMEFNGFASFATPFTTYNVAGNLGYRVMDSVPIGPGLAFTGNEAYKDVRIGPHVGIRFPSGEVDVDAGYRHAFTRSASDGYFLTIGVSFALQ